MTTQVLCTFPLSQLPAANPAGPMSYRRLGVSAVISGEQVILMLGGSQGVLELEQEVRDGGHWEDIVVSEAKPVATRGDRHWLLAGGRLSPAMSDCPECNSLTAKSFLSVQRSHISTICNAKMSSAACKFTTSHFLHTPLVLRSLLHCRHSVLCP